MEKKIGKPKVSFHHETNEEGQRNSWPTIALPTEIEGDGTESAVFFARVVFGWRRYLIEGRMPAWG